MHSDEGVKKQLASEKTLRLGTAVLNNFCKRLEQSSEGGRKYK